MKKSGIFNTELKLNLTAERLNTELKLNLREREEKGKERGGRERKNLLYSLFLINCDWIHEKS